MKSNIKVRVSYGETKNTGNYESKRMDLSVEMDTTVDLFAQDQSYWLQRLKHLVQNELVSTK